MTKEKYYRHMAVHRLWKCAAFLDNDKHIKTNEQDNYKMRRRKHGVDMEKHRINKESAEMVLIKP